MASPPRHQNAFPLHPLKSVLVSRPQAGLFSILHARALFPPRSVPNCKQTGIGKGGAFAPPNSFDQESQNCPIQGKANNGRGADAPYLNRVRNGGLILARNAPSIVQPVCACQCIARPVSRCAPPNTMSQVIHGRPEVAPKASRREAVNNLAAAGPQIPGHTAAGSRFAPASPRSAPHHPARVLSRIPTTPAARVQKSERTSPREGHRIRLTMNRVIPTSGAAKSQRKESEMKTWNDMTHFAGFDWAKDHHDVLVLDGAGKIVANFASTTPPQAGRSARKSWRSFRKWPSRWRLGTARPLKS